MMPVPTPLHTESVAEVLADMDRAIGECVTQGLGQPVIIELGLMQMAALRQARMSDWITSGDYRAGIAYRDPEFFVHRGVKVVCGSLNRHLVCICERGE